MKGERFERARLRITRGAMYVAIAVLGMSIVYLLSPEEVRRSMREWLVASHSSVFEHGRVWTLVTSPLIELNFIGLLLEALMLWQLAPTLERFWGTGRFLRFVAITSVTATVAGTLFGFVSGFDTPVTGLSGFMLAMITAYGIVYAKQQVQFFGVLPLTARQFMFGMLAFFALSVVLQQDWTRGVSLGASAGVAAMMVSKKWSPGLAWKRWRIARARSRLTVMQGGVPSAKARPSGGRDEQRWLN